MELQLELGHLVIINCSPVFFCGRAGNGHFQIGRYVLSFEVIGRQCPLKKWPQLIIGRNYEDILQAHRALQPQP